MDFEYWGTGWRNASGTRKFAAPASVRISRTHIKTGNSHMCLWYCERQRQEDWSSTLGNQPSQKMVSSRFNQRLSHSNKVEHDRAGHRHHPLTPVFMCKSTCIHTHAHTYMHSHMYIYHHPPKLKQRTKVCKLSIVAHTYNSSTWEAEGSHPHEYPWIYG